MENFNFNRDFFEGCAALGERDGAALAWALLRYGYAGEEPKGLKPAAKAAFSFARGRIDAMVSGSGGGMPGRPRKARTPGGGVPREGGNAASRGVPAETPETAGGGVPGEIPETPSRGVSAENQKTPSGGVSGETEPGNGETPAGEKEKEKEKKKEIASAISKEAPAPSADPAGFEPPSEGEVRDYFGANCLRGDPAEFIDHFGAQGWVRSNGQPVADWRAQARLWSRRQVEFDASKPADLRQPERPLPVAENARDYEAELAAVDAEIAAMRGKR